MGVCVKDILLDILGTTPALDLAIVCGKYFVYLC